ncbi:Non-histone chromosomal protein HMG-14 [Vulpes lagopus]
MPVQQERGKTNSETWRPPQQLGREERQRPRQPRSAEAPARPPPHGPGGRSARPRAGAAKEEPKRSPRGGRRGCPLNLLPRKWKRSQKRRQERINLQTKKCKQRGRGEQREDRLKWLTKKRKNLPAENGETKNEESPASDEAGEREAKSD